MKNQISNRNKIKIKNINFDDAQSTIKSKDTELQNKGNENRQVKYFQLKYIAIGFIKNLNVEGSHSG